MAVLLASKEPKIHVIPFFSVLLSQYGFRFFKLKPCPIDIGKESQMVREFFQQKLKYGGGGGGIYFLFFLFLLFWRKWGWMESTVKKKITIQSKVAIAIHELVK